MSYIYKNITGSASTDLKIDFDPLIKHTKISMSNIHASDAVTIDLWLYRRESDTTYLYDDNGRRSDGSYDEPIDIEYNYYILKNCIIPNGVTLILDECRFFFNNSKYALYIKLNASDSSVDVIINADNLTDSVSVNTSSTY